MNPRAEAEAFVLPCVPKMGVESKAVVLLCLYKLRVGANSVLSLRLLKLREGPIVLISYCCSFRANLIVVEFAD